MKQVFALVIAGILAIPSFGQIRDKAQGHDDSFRSPSSVILKQKLDSVTSEMWVNSGNYWAKSSVTQYYYDGYGNLNQQINEHWDLQSAQWIKDNKVNYTFLYPHKPALIERYYWNLQTSSWKSSFKSVFTYDTAGDLLKLETFEPAANPCEWVSVSSIEYSYDAWNFLISETHFIWDTQGNSWDLDRKLEYCYDESALLSIQTEYIWNLSTAQWEFYYKQEFSYDNNANLTADHQSYWDKPSNAWLPVMKTENEYNNNCQVVCKTEYDWDSFSNAWHAVNKTESSYEPSGTLINECMFYWDAELHLWLIQDKNLFVYSNGFSFDDLLLPYSLPFAASYFNFMLNDIVFCGYQNSNFLPAIKETFYYSTIALSGIDNLDDLNFNIYPNPALDYVIFSWKSVKPEYFIELYDLSARKVMDAKVARDNPLYLGGLSDGLYIYKLMDGKAIVKTGKIVKQ
ncbi:MAG: T9SS type A sorting domain-containing protein [Bacteroidota bacterium]